MSFKIDNESEVEKIYSSAEDTEEEKKGVFTTFWESGNAFKICIIFIFIFILWLIFKAFETWNVLPFFKNGQNQYLGDMLSLIVTALLFYLAYAGLDQKDKKEKDKYEKIERLKIKNSTKITYLKYQNLHKDELELVNRLNEFMNDTSVATYKALIEVSEEPESLIYDIKSLFNLLIQKNNEVYDAASEIIGNEGSQGLISPEVYSNILALNKSATILKLITNDYAETINRYINETYSIEENSLVNFLSTANNTNNGFKKIMEKLIETLSAMKNPYNKNIDENKSFLDIIIDQYEIIYSNLTPHYPEINETVDADSVDVMEKIEKSALNSKDPYKLIKYQVTNEIYQNNKDIYEFEFPTKTGTILLKLNNIVKYVILIDYRRKTYDFNANSNPIQKNIEWLEKKIAEVNPEAKGYLISVFPDSVKESMGMIINDYLTGKNNSDIKEDSNFEVEVNNKFEIKSYVISESEISTINDKLKFNNY